MKNFKISSYSIVTFLGILSGIAMLSVPATAMFAGEETPGNDKATTKEGSKGAPGGEKVVDRVKAWEEKTDNGSIIKPRNAEDHKKGEDDEKPSSGKNKDEKPPEYKPPTSKAPATDVIVIESKEELEKYALACKGIIHAKQIEIKYALTEIDLQILVDGNNLLQRITLYDCSNLKSISLLGNLNKLTYLQLFKCKKITSIDDLGEAARLTTLSLHDCPKLRSLKGLLTNLEKFPYLVVLDIMGHSNHKVLSKQIDQLREKRSHLKINASQEPLTTKKTKGTPSKVDQGPITPRKRSNSVNDLLAKGSHIIRPRDKAKRKGTEIGKGKSRTKQHKEGSDEESKADQHGEQSEEELENENESKSITKETIPREVVLSNKEDYTNYCQNSFKKKVTASVIRIGFELSNEEFLFLLKTSPNIEELEIRNCGNITSIECLSGLPKLRSLKLQNCTALKDLNALLTLSNLTTLELTYCPTLTSSHVLINLTQLRTLDLTGSKLEEINSLEAFPKLTSLKLKECTKLVDIKGLKDLKQIISLDLSSCDSLAKFEPLIGLTSIEILTLNNTSNFTNVHTLSHLVKLTCLDLCNCAGVKNLDAIKNLLNLRVLKLTNCSNLESIRHLSALRKLTELHLQSCTGVQDFSVFKDPNLRSLKTLNLNNCTGLCDIEVLAKLTKLTDLYLAYCAELDNIDSLPKGITHLYLNECKNLRSIAPLLESTSLRHVDLTECIHLDEKDIDILRLSCPSVITGSINTRGSTASHDTVVFALEQRCSVVNPEALREFLAGWAQGQPFSTQLRISHAITDSELSKLVDKNPHIEDIDLEDCSQLTNIDPLGNLPKLSTVRLHNGKHLKSIDPLAGSDLTLISLHKCLELKSIDVLLQLKNLKHVEIKECPHLENGVECLKSKLPGVRVHSPMSKERRRKKAIKILPRHNKKDPVSPSTSPPKGDEGN